MISVTLSLLLALSPVTVTEIPRNFLLTERDARRHLSPEEAAELGYEISDKLTKPLELNPCVHRSSVDRDRVAARTISHWTSGPSGSSEQLVIYKSSRAAHAAFTLCAPRPRSAHARASPRHPNSRFSGERARPRWGARPSAWATRLGRTAA